MPRRPDGGSLSPRAANTRLAAISLALLRVFLGLHFLWEGAQHWDWIGTPRLAHQLAAWAQATPFERYAHFLIHSVIPQAAPLTYLVVFGELGIGLCLLLGLLTRAASLAALLFSLNLLPATWSQGVEAQRLSEALLAIEIALLLAGAGRSFGLDARLARKRPGWVLW